ncbi:MAG: TatD family hydrolase [Neisseriaceae bacterium]|nr:TatD family hydrolase [Neisseriaceae bacterium]
MIDTHCHLTETVFRLPETFQAASLCGVTQFISVSTNPDDWQYLHSIAQSYPQVIPAFGIHPLWHHLTADLDKMAVLLQTFPQALIGEIGLDFYDGRTQQDAQIQCFQQQLDMAQQFHRPILIHQRKADDFLFPLLKNHHASGIVHGFSGSLNQAKKWLDLGFFLGIGTVLLRPNARLRSVLPQLPLDDWVLESDAPFMYPNNTPSIIHNIAQTAADLYGVSIDCIEENTNRNAQNILKQALC